MATESHPTFLSADTETVRVHFSVNNISFPKESAPHRGFITEIWGAVDNRGSVGRENGQGAWADVFEILILSGEKKEAIMGKPTNLVASSVILMNNIVVSSNR